MAPYKNKRNECVSVVNDELHWLSCIIGRVSGRCIEEAEIFLCLVVNL